MDVMPEQPEKGYLASVTSEKSSNGNATSPEQLSQATPNLLTPLNTSNGQTNEVMLDARFQALVRSVPKLAPERILTEVI